MSTTLMTCGHTAQGVRTSDNAPACVICGCLDVAPTAPDLTGRMAHCYKACTPKPSSTALPFFKHRPDQPTDTFYCGCYGWD